MAAYVILLSQTEARALRDLRGRCREGAIVVYPEEARAFKKKYRKDLQDLRGQVIDYDYGGEPELVLDFLSVGEDDEAFWAEKVLCDKLGIKTEDEE